MNTQSHAIINLFLLKKLTPAGERKPDAFHLPIVLGAILPDVPIFLFFIWYSLIDPTPQGTIWRTLYFDDDWQLFFNLFNSIPLYLIIAAAAWHLSRTRLFFFSLANLLHFVEDFFLHMEDAHAHFFPLSGYKFSSAISYWDRSGYGHYVSTLEAVIVLLLSVILFRQLKSRWGRVLLVLANLFTLGGYLMWRFIFFYL